MAELLVSVRSVAEAEAALAGGAAIIDVKEPSRGPLGRADDQTIRAVITAVGGRRPVSAALGELVETTAVELDGLGFVKWGLSRCGRRAGWEDDLASRAGRLPPSCRPVAVAYADWRLAGAPAPDEVLTFARSRGWTTFLLDTWRKDGRTLLDRLAPDEVTALCGVARGAGVRVALAGSLGAEQIQQLRGAGPDWFAVRGAACAGGRREQAVCADRVRRLAALL